MINIFIFTHINIMRNNTMAELKKILYLGHMNGE